MENVMRIMTIAFIGLLVIGFLIGFARSWKRSLIRFGILFACALLAALITPVITKQVVDRFVNGLVISAFGYTVNFEEVAKNALSDDAFATLFAAGSTTSNLVTAMMNIVINLVLFVVLFFVLAIISGLIYGIVCIIVRSRNKDKEERKLEGLWWKRLIGGGIGAFGALVVCFVLFTPVFGVMSVCDKFLETKTTESVSAASFNHTTYVSGQLYYTENKRIGKIEKYVETYAGIRESYNKSIPGTVLKLTGINFLGEKTFAKLTTVSNNGLDVNLTNELVSGIKVYNAYKDAFVANEFNLAKNESVEKLEDIYEIATESNILKSYVVELVPNACEKWSNDESYFGVSFPVDNEFKDVAKLLLGVFKTKNFNQISDNVSIVFDVLRAANKENNKVIESLNNKVDVKDILKGDNTFVKDTVLALSTSAEMRSILPRVMNSLIGVVYKNVISDTDKQFTSTLTDEEIATINWNNEAVYMQNIVTSIFNVYDSIGSTDDSTVMINHLVDVGEVIDSVRKSKILSGSLQEFIVDYINSSNFKLSQDVKDIITEQIQSPNWDDENYSFADMFSALQETASIANSIADGNFEELFTDGLDNIADTIKNIVNNDDLQSTISSVIDSGVISELTGSNDSTTNALTEVLDALVNISSEEEDEEVRKQEINDAVDAAIASGNEILGLVNAVNNNEEYVFEGETEQDKVDSATTMVENIASSTVVMDMLDQESSAVQDMVQNIQIDRDVLSQGIEAADIDESQASILRSLFGL